MKFVGDGIRKKIVEYLETGRMAKVEFLKADQKLNCLEQMASVWGIGPNNALKLYHAGFKSIEDLRTEKG